MYRILTQELIKKTNKVLLLLGPRQVGKTTILKNIFPTSCYINLEKSDYIDIFNTRDLDKMKNLIQVLPNGSSQIWILDEAQRLDNPGLVAKVIFDELKDIRLIISGSSALEIHNKTSESLAGRKKTLYLYPLSLYEKLVQMGNLKEFDLSNWDKKILDFEEKRDGSKVTKDFITEQIKQSMLWGNYPELLDLENYQDKQEYLLELVDSVILKDIFYFNLVKNTKNLIALLKLLAYQIGQLVNITDLANRLGISRSTVVDYLELLEKSFIVFRLSPFTKKRRDEIGKTEKIYFYDLGLRNALIRDFSPVEFRVDYGNIFENFVISEFLKLNSYYKNHYGLHYWRTTWGSEVDLVLQKDGQLLALEIKTRKGKITPAFKNTYPNAIEQVITLENFWQLFTNS